MAQVILYDEFHGYFLFFRGGYDQQTKKGLDPYEFDTDPVSTYKGFSPTFPIKHGYLIHAHSNEEKLKVGKFFFGESFSIEEKKDYIASGEYMLCFDKNLRTVFYKKGEQAPVRTTRHCKTRNKFYKEWIRPYSDYQVGNIPPCDITGYSFKKGQKYLICNGSTFGCFIDIIPEIVRLPETEKLAHSTELCEYMWNLEPIDLSQSWDYSEEEKAEFRRKFYEIDEQRRKAAEELEERRNTPGFCDVCGKPADYVEDPYQYEMYGTHHMCWLCPDCYHEACMDV